MSSSWLSRVLSRPGSRAVSRLHRRMSAKRRKVVRRRALDRAGWRCEMCGVPGLLEVDHRVPLRLGGDPYCLSNLQALCRDCHLTKTAREDARETGKLATGRERIRSYSQ